MPTVDTSSGARERILDAAYELFSRRGVRAVGIDTIVAQAGVARMTLYRHFSSKDELVIAFLQRREERWTDGWLRREVTARASDGAERLLTIFDVFDEWFQDPDFEACSFINVLLEFPAPDAPARAASIEHLASIRTFVEQLAAEAGVEDPAGFARDWHILMKGSIVAAAEGDRAAARRAQAIGRSLIEQRSLRAGRARARP